MLPVAILAGGLAQRLRPLTETIPKALVEVAGEPFAAHQLRLLARSGVRRVVFCLGYMGERVQEFAGDGSRFGLRIDYAFDGPVLRGTAGALAGAAPLLGETFLVVYGDSYLPCDYAAVERQFLESGKGGLMTVHRNEGRWDSSNVEYKDEVIVAYDKENRTKAMRYIDYGLGALHARALQGIPEVYDLASLYQDLLRLGDLAAFEVPQRFYEIGSFGGIEELSEYLSRK